MEHYSVITVHNNKLHLLITVLEQKYTYKGKKLKNKLQSKLKRKQKVHEKKTERYTSNVRKEDSVSSETKPIAEEPPKPVYTVFSKLDFLGETTTIADKAIMKKETTNKKQLLEKLEKNKTFVKRLEESGNIEKANKIKEEAMWSNVLKKAEGIKVKDDPALLKKSLMKKQAKKKVSEKKWKTRIKGVEKQKLERQKKRKENIDKRLQERKKKKFKKAIKKGRYIPNL